MSGKVTVPFSETRVSVVRSGFWNTVMRDVAGAQRVFGVLRCCGAGQAEQHERSDGAKTGGKLLKESFDH